MEDKQRLDKPTEEHESSLSLSLSPDLVDRLLRGPAKRRPEGSSGSSLDDQRRRWRQVYVRTMSRMFKITAARLVAAC